MNTNEKINTLHPDSEKKGVNISLEKYEQVKKFILNIMEQRNIISYQELNDLAVNQLKKTFAGKIPWYVVTVKLDLEARRIIKRIQGSSPQMLQMVKKQKASK